MKGEMTKALSNYYFDQLDYFLKQNQYYIISAEYEIQSAIQYTSRAANACERSGEKELADQINAKLEEYYSRYLLTQKLSSQ